MVYCSLDRFRSLTGISTVDLSDTEATLLLDRATRIIMEDLFIKVYGETLSGNIDGSNTTFSTACYPIADQDGDRDVDGGDLTVYIWGSSGDIDTRSTVPVSTVHPDLGLIVLSSAPDSTIDQVTCDYAYSLYRLNWDLIEIACAYLAGALYSAKTYLLLPDRIAEGAIRYSYSDLPHIRFRDEYYNVMSLVKSEPIVKGTTEDLELLREEME